MEPKRIAKIDKNVSPNWKPVSGLAARKPGMTWSDRVWYWLRSLGGVGLAGVGVLFILYLHLPIWGAAFIGAGLVIFATGPSQTARNGHTDA